MSIFTGIATGFLSAAIKDKEAKDNLRMKIAESAGIDYYTKDKPAHEKKQKLFEKDFKMVELKYGTNIANLFGDQGGFYGDGNGLKYVDSILEKKNIDKEALKNFKFSTFEERQAGRESEFQSRGDQIKNLTGIGGIGPKAAELSLEGFGKTETTDVAPSETTDMAQATDTEQRVSTDISSLFTDKPVSKDINVESKYQHIGKAIQDQFGYADSVTMEGGNILLNFAGGNRKIHNAHLSITNMILNTSNLNQDDAAKEAKLHLDNLTVAPFMRLEKELKGKYTESQGGGAASIGAGSIDVLTTQIDGMSLKTHIFNQIEALPKNRYGKPDSAILARFIQNIPDNFMINNETFKTQIENAFKTEEIAFKLS